jgi:ribosome biogenesis GTP-binding protein YsxC/EngB
VLVILLILCTKCHAFAPHHRLSRQSILCRVTSSNGSNKLTRPERKALERQKKQKNNNDASKSNNQRRKQNFAELKQPNENSTSYDLNSQAIRALTRSSTPDDVIRAIKRAQNRHDAQDLATIERFLLEQTDETYAYGYRGSLLARLAVAALHMNNHRLARLALEERYRHHRQSILPLESAAIVRGLLRVHNVSDAQFVLDDELPLPTAEEIDQPSVRDVLKHRALSLASFASRHFFENEPSLAVLGCRKLVEMGPLVVQAGMTDEEIGIPWSRILKGAAQCEAGRRDGSVQPCVGVDIDSMPCNLVYAVLNAINAFPPMNSDTVYEQLSNALIRRVVFVTGAVDMQKCPPADRGEVAFIGRSNVGKSSLVNMVTNRKSIAFVSKRPGKTQQFNFFAVNDKAGVEKEIKYGDVVEGEKDADSFYMVDLPGFGYAKAPDAQKQKWKEFMHLYITKRPNLRVLFHLVDARHGPTDEDAAIMKQISEDKPPHVQYVIVLTKADKNVKGAAATNTGKVSRDVMKKVQTTMEENGVAKAPVILSSAQTKLGRNEIWKYLRRAAEF